MEPIEREVVVLCVAEEMDNTACIPDRNIRRIRGNR